MNCTPKTINGQAESILAKYLTSEINDGDMNATTEQLKYFRSPKFIKEFGDYDSAYNSNYEGDTAEMAFRVDDNGEPLLQYNTTANKHYYIDKTGQEVYFPLYNKGLRGLFSYQEIEALTSRFALQYFKASGINFNNINFKEIDNLPNLREAVQTIINNKVEQLESSEDFDIQLTASSIDLLNEHIDEIVTRVKNYFSSISIKLTEDENTPSIDEVEQSGREGLNLQSSAERDSKANVSTNVKLRLSLLTDVEYQLDIDSLILIDAEIVSSTSALNLLILLVSLKSVPF